jgi:hypothetical protein
VVVSVGAGMAWLREGSKRDSSTAQTDSFAGAKEEEEVGLLRSE